MSEAMSAAAAAPAAESTSGAVEGLAAESSAAEEPKPAQKTPKMRRVKINGQEEYVNEDEVFRDYQKYRAGEKKLKEAADMRSSVEEFYRKLQEDPDSVLRDPKLSVNRRELAERWLTEELEKELRYEDPREKKMSELERRLQEYEERERTAKEEAEMSEREKFIESRKQSISQVLHEAMQSSKLAKHEESKAALLREMAVYMRAAKERGEDVSPKELVDHIQNARFNQFYSLAHQFQGPELLEFLGEEIVNRIRRADLERIKSKRNQPAQSWKSTESRSEPSSNSKFINPSEARWALRNID